MTIPAASTRTTFAGAGSTGPYPYTFRIFSTADLVVTKRSVSGIDTELPYGSGVGGWTLTAGVVVGTVGGSITLGTALAVGETLVLRRAPDIDQPTSIQNQGSYFPKTHEDEFDRLAMQIQGVDDRARRSFGLPESYDPDANPTTLKPANGYVLGWSGGQIANVLVDNSANVVLPGGGRTVATLTALLANNIVTYNVKDFGAIGDGVTDDTIAIQLAFDTACAAVLAESAAQDHGIVLYFPRGVYLITNTVNITVDRVHVRGEGKYVSTIKFNPAAAKACFYCSNPTVPGSLYQGSFSRLGFRGAGAQQKIAVDGLDLSEYVFEDIAIASSWTGNSGSGATPSIGFRISARELLTFNRVDVFCDRPFHFRKGSNAAIGADHFHFHDLYMGVTVAAEVGILIDVDCIITSWIMDGYQSWIGGTHSLHALASAACLSVNIRNARREQPGANGGFAVWWEAATKGFLLDGCNFGGVAGPTNGGVKIRNTRCITILNCVYTGSADATAIALDVDATCDDINIINFFAQATSLANGLGSFLTIWGVPKIDSNAPFPPTAYYYRSGAGALRTLTLMGVETEFLTVDLAPAATQALALNGQGAVAGRIRVDAYAAVGPIQETGEFTVNPTSTIKLSGTAGCVTPIGTGNVSVEWYAGPVVLVRNNTGQTLKMIISSQWRR